MDEKLLELFKYVDPKNFKNATEKTLKKSLQDLSDYFATSQGRKKVRLNYDWYKIVLKKQGKEDEIQSTDAVAFVNYICLMPSDKLTVYQSYIRMLDCVIHENFHQFQYYLLNIPKEFVDDVMWQRIFSYNLDFMINSVPNFHLYRFCDTELDAYRVTDFMLYNVYKNFKRQGVDVEMLKKHIMHERKEFIKDAKNLKSDFGEFAKRKINKWLKKQAIKSIKESEELECSNKEVYEKMKNGEYIFSIKNNNEIADISQEFINKMMQNFKSFMPYLYGTSKPKFHDGSFLKQI